MPTTQLADVVIPAQFTAYQVEQSVLKTAVFQSGVIAKNAVMAAQLNAGATQFTVPFWRDLPDVEADLTSDDPTVMAVPQKITAGKQNVRKNFLHESWSSMDLASELAGSDPLSALQNRVSAYWDRQFQKRLISTLTGILQSNAANNQGDMITDISSGTGVAAQFSASAVIQTATTMGDASDSLKAIAMHSYIYSVALQNDLIQFIPQSQGLPIKTFRGLAVIVDDGLAISGSSPNFVFTTVLIGDGAIGFAASAPNNSPGTELARVPAAGNGGGQSTLHSRLNMALHPLGFSWSDGTGAGSIVGESPSIADLAIGSHWTRVTATRKSIPLAFLVSK